MIAVLIVLVLLTVSGALAIMAQARMERAALVVAELRPATWRGVTASMAEATDELRVCISDRIDR